MLFNSKMFLSKTLFYVILITHFIQTTAGKKHDAENGSRCPDEKKNAPVYGECFTMPPKHTKLSQWSVVMPDVNAPSYEHDTYDCPPGYVTFNKYSRTHSQCMGCSKHSFTEWSVISHAVCCRVIS